MLCVAKFSSGKADALRDLPSRLDGKRVSEKRRVFYDAGRTNRVVFLPAPDPDQTPRIFTKSDGKKQLPPLWACSKAGRWGRVGLGWVVWWLVAGWLAGWHGAWCMMGRHLVSTVVL